MEYQYQSVQRQLQDAQRSLATKEHELNSERALVRACSPAMLCMGMQSPAAMHAHSAMPACMGMFAHRFPLERHRWEHAAMHGGEGSGSYNLCTTCHV